MGFHDYYAGILPGISEFMDFKKNFTVQNLTKEQIKQLVDKCKYNLRLTDDMAKAFRDRLPKNYEPSQSRIDEQAEAYEGFNELLVEAEIESLFTPLGRAAVIGAPKVSRGDAALLRFIYNYGTEDNKTLLTEKANVLARVYARQQEFKERKEESLSLAYKTIEKPLNALNAEYAEAKNKIKAADPSANPNDVPEIQAMKERIAALRKPYDDAAASLRKEEAAINAEFNTVLEDFYGAYIKVAPEELKHAAAGVDAFVDMQNKSSDPKTMKANYKESRNKNSLYGESEGLLSTFKGKFTEEEFKNLRIQFGKAYAFNMKYLAEANFLAHPISKFVDMNAMKKLDPNDVSAAVENLTEDFYHNTAEETENSFINNLDSMRQLTYSEWSVDVTNLFGLEKGEVVFQQDGEIDSLTVDNVYELYEKGKPFYAKPLSMPDAEPILVQPLPGGHLAYGDHITDIQIEEPAVPEAPNPLVMAWDSVISAIGGLFGKDWRLDSVVNYERNMARYRADKNCYDGLTETRANMAELTDSKLISDMSVSMNNHIEKEAEARELSRLKAAADLRGMSIEEYKVLEQQEAERKAAEEQLRAERTEKLSKTGLDQKDSQKIMDMWETADELRQRAGREGGLKHTNLASLIAAATVENLIAREITSLSGSDSKSLSPALAAFLNKKSGKTAITGLRNHIQNEPGFSEFAGTISGEQIQKLAEGRMDSVKAAKIMNISANYNKFKAEYEASAEKEKTLEEKSLSEDNKTVEANKDIAMNNPS